MNSMENYQQYSTALLSLLVFSVFAKAISITRVWLKRRQLMVHHKCQPVAYSLGTRPFGLDFLVQQKRANDAYRLLDFQDEQFKRHGNTLGVNGVQNVKYITCEPKLIQFVLATRFDNFPKRPLAIAATGFLGNESIFMVDGAKWEHARAMLKPQFLRDLVADFTELEVHVEKFLERACPSVAEGKLRNKSATIDIQTLFHDLLFDSATENLLGESANTQELKDKGLANDAVVFSDAFDLATRVAAVRVGLGAIVSWLLLGWDLNRRYERACKVCNAYVEPYIEKAIMRYSKRTQTTTGEYETERTKKKKYVALNEFADGTQHRKALQSHSMGFLLAGRDTTSGLLSWAIYLLARHPQSYSVLRKEILDAFGPRGERESKALPDYTTLKSLPYVRWVLRETLRLYPLVTINERLANKDVVLPLGGGPDGQSPMLLKAGEGIAWSLHSMHRRKDLYGEDAEEFRPERWDSNDEAGQRLKSIGWGYLPFHGGPRTCMGQQRALNEGSYILARIAQAFSKIELPDDMDVENDCPQYNMGLITTSAVGVRVKLTR